MTTAHRPTWKAAVGRAGTGGWSAGGAISTAQSAFEAPAQLTLKTLRKPVDKKKALRESLLALEKAEAKAVPKRKLDPAVEERAQQRLLKQSAEVDVQAIQSKYDDSDVDDGGGSGQGDDGDDAKNNASDDTDLDDSDSDLDDDSDEEDDEAALQAELAKIRAEREEAKRKAAEEEAEEERKEDESAALVGNPLLAVGAVAVGQPAKRRWNEDVVFRSQAKGEPKNKKRFINDTVRTQ